MTVENMTKGRTARLLAFAAMVTGLVTIVPAQAGAQDVSNKAPVGATPGGWATENYARMKASDLPADQRKAAKAADSDELLVSTPATTSYQTETSVRTAAFVAINNLTQHTSSLMWRDWGNFGWDHEWNNVTTPGNLLLGTPTATWSTDVRTLWVYVVNSDGVVYENSWDNHYGIWGNWVPLGGRALSSPTARSSANNRVDLFMVGGGGRLFQKYKEGTVWHDWTAISDGPPGGFGADPSSTWTNNGTRLDIFTVSAGNRHVYQWTWTASAGWGAWTDLGGVLSAAVSADWVANGSRIDIFGVGANNQLFQKYWTAGAGWHDWTAFQGPATGVCACAPSVSWIPDGNFMNLLTLDNARPEVGYYTRTWTNGWGWNDWRNLFTS